MTRAFIVRPRADFDLDELVEHIALRDPRAALRFESWVRETYRRIERFPAMASVRTTSRGPVRLRQVLRYPRFLIIYRFDDTVIEVIRIVRGARDLDKLLGT
jgi:toxin ParE1/3/4